FLAVLIFFFRSLDISFFIWTYSSILLLGTLLEMYVIKHITQTKVDLGGGIGNYLRVMKDVFWPHLDYILFNVFPLLLMVLSASHLRIEEMGRVNFSIQMINLIFLFSTTAHMRVNAYVANGGIQGKFDKFWKLLAITSMASMVGSALVYGATHFLPQIELFSSFLGVSQLFLISLIALPGFILFQFFNPIWIELKKLKTTVSLQLLNFAVCISLSPFILDQFGPKGFLWIFSLFYFNNIPIHLWLYWRSFIKETKPLANERTSLREFNPK
ncbi:MAG: hypothetical protein GW917_01385, partial [Bdellovibrionales bacterium]|nr:hypothetical protein [Bdellovibrionales bacterium]